MLFFINLNCGWLLSLRLVWSCNYIVSMDRPNSSGILQSFKGVQYMGDDPDKTRGPTFGRGAWQSLRPQTDSNSKPAYHHKTDPTWLCNAHADYRLSLSVSVSTSDPLITCSLQGGILARVSSVVVERPLPLLWACCLSLNASSLAGDFCVEKFYLTGVVKELANKCGKLKKDIDLSCLEGRNNEV